MIILSLEQWVLIVYKSIFLLSLEQRVCFIHLVLSTPPETVWVHNALYS